MPETDKRTTREIGESEPGWESFRKAYRRQGTSDDAFVKYAKYLGSVRKLSPKPLLKLSVPELEELDDRLLAKAKVFRTLLGMFYRGNRRLDLVEALPRQRRPKGRRLGLDDILLPEDVMSLIQQAGSLRDRAIIATLAATGGRISEVLGLRLKDVKVSNGGYQMWFGQTKVKSQERFSPKIEDPWKSHLKGWLDLHPARHDPETWLFPSTVAGSGHVAAQTVADMLRSCARKAGVRKRSNPHALRHARVSWGIMRREDTATLCIGVWGVPTTMQLNRYTHFHGLEGANVGMPKPRELPPVPALPVPPVLSTQRRVGELTDEVRELRAKYAAMERAFQVVASKLALDEGIPPGAELTVRIPPTGRPVSEVTIEDRAADDGSSG